MTETEQASPEVRRMRMRFEPMPSGKVRCTLCKREGWPGDENGGLTDPMKLNPWQVLCLREHIYECDRSYCHRRFPSKTARSAHLRQHA